MSFCYKNRFLDEAKKKKLKELLESGFLLFCKHSNILRYITTLKSKDKFWIVTEFCEGLSLAETIKCYSFTESDVGEISRQLLCAIEYIHSEALVHRDIKPANIMLTVEGLVKLSEKIEKRNKKIKSRTPENFIQFRTSGSISSSRTFSQDFPKTYRLSGHSLSQRTDAREVLSQWISANGQFATISSKNLRLSGITFAKSVT